MQGLWKDFFGTGNDGRKREYGSLNEIRRRSALKNKRKHIRSTGEKPVEETEKGIR